MAIPKTSFHIRSISLPSTSHPIDASIDDHLRRLSASQACPSSSSSIYQTLCSLKDLYELVNDLIHLPHNQQVLSDELHWGVVEEVLDGSLSLLDVSSSVLDSLFQMKESILDLQSELRRGSDDEGIHTYLMSRKKMSKTIFKCLSNLKKAEKSCQENDATTIGMLKEVEAISLSTLKSVLSYVMGKKGMGLSLVAKLVKSSKHISCETENTSEVEETDRVLRSLSKKQSGFEMKVLLKELETLEMIIYELEDGMEFVSRCLVKTRVTLLNVLNH